MGSSQGKSIIDELQSEFPGLKRHVIAGCVASFRGPKAQLREHCRHKLRLLISSTGFCNNKQLEVLDHVFPLVSKAELRRCIGRASNIFDAALLVLTSKVPKLGRRVKLAQEDYFRPIRFQQAVRDTMLNRYPLLWSNSIEQVVAEQNYDPPRCIEVLNGLDARRTSGWFDWYERRRRKVVYCPMLVQEFTNIQTEEDCQLARRINQEEYNNSGNAMECACCFTDVPFEDVIPCSEGHVFCTDCMDNFIKTLSNGGFGTRVTERHAGGPKCFSTDECGGSISRTYLSEKQRREMDDFLRKQCFSVRACRDLGVTLCHYCGDQARPPRSTFCVLIEQKLVLLWLIAVAVLIARIVFLHVDAGLRGLLLPSSGLAMCYWYYTANTALRNALTECSDKLSSENQSTYVRCVNPSCSVEFCSACTGEADHTVAMHLCFEDLPDECSLESFTAYVGRAMSKVAVRVCPGCLLQFQKEDGCNRMRCTCGYEMCYLCRREVTDYSHFCDHFRVVPGAKCAQCNKCELWLAEDEPVVVRAVQNAVALFHQKHPNFRAQITGPVVIQGLRVF